MSRYFPRFTCSMSRLSWVGLSSTADPTIPQQLSGIFFQELTWTEKIPKRGTSKLYWFRGTTTQTFSWIEVNIMSFHRLVIYFCIQVGVTSSDCRIVCLIAYYTVHVLSSCRIPIHPTGMECCSCFWSLNILPSKDIFQTYAIETTSRLRVVHQSCYSSK